MKSCVCFVALQLLALVVADVSHLNNMYLPPQDTTQDIEDVSTTESYNAPLPLGVIKDAVVQHMQERYEIESATTEQAAEEIAAPSQNLELELPALPEVSNGIETRYGSNGGYIY